MDILIPLGLLLLHSIFCGCVGLMAKDYKRSPIAWFILSFLFSPIAGFVFLRVAGAPQGASVEEDILPDNLTATEEDREDKAVATHEVTCPKCDASMNTHTGRGIWQKDEKQPWALYCEKCKEPLPPACFGA